MALNNPSPDERFQDQEHSAGSDTSTGSAETAATDKLFDVVDRLHRLAVENLDKEQPGPPLTTRELTGGLRAALAALSVLRPSSERCSSPRLDRASDQGEGHPGGPTQKSDNILEDGPAPASSGPSISLETIHLWPTEQGPRTGLLVVTDLERELIQAARRMQQQVDMQPTGYSVLHRLLLSLEHQRSEMQL